MRLFGHGETSYVSWMTLNCYISENTIKYLEKTYLTFHGVRMYIDAGKLKGILENGRIPECSAHVEK